MYLYIPLLFDIHTYNVNYKANRTGSPWAQAHRWHILIRQNFSSRPQPTLVIRSIWFSIILWLEKCGDLVASNVDNTGFNLGEISVSICRLSLRINYSYFFPPPLSTSPSSSVTAVAVCTEWVHRNREFMQSIYTAYRCLMDGCRL